jgi:hypothetical protein
VGVALGSGYQSYFTTLSASDQQQEIARMRAAHISWVRMDADWNTVQPTASGGFDWSVPDLTAKVMLAAGMRLDVLLYESPTWARHHDLALRPGGVRVLLERRGRHRGPVRAGAGGRDGQAGAGRAGLRGRRSRIGAARRIGLRAPTS